MNNGDNKQFNRFQFFAGEESIDNKANAEDQGEKKNKSRSRRSNRRYQNQRRRTGKKANRTKKEEVVEDVEVLDDVVMPYTEKVMPYSEKVMPYEEPSTEVTVPVVEEEKKVVEEVMPYTEKVMPYEEKNAYDAELASIKEKGIHLNEAKDIDLDHTLYRDQFFVTNGDSEDEIVAEVKEALKEEQPTETTPVETHTIKKVYLSFQARVILLVIGIVLLFGAACFIIISTLRSNEIKKVDYVEKTTIHYDVCQTSNNPYESNCLKEGQEYNSKTSSNIHIDYHYDALFDEDIDYNMTYHVVVVNKIFDKYDNSKISYEDEDLIKDTKTIASGTNPASVDVAVEVDYQKYYKFVNEYKQKYTLNADSTLNVVLYMDDGNETRNVGEVIIPIGDEKFDITRKEVTDSKQVYLLRVKDWTNTNTLYIVVGSIFVLLSLFLLFHLTRLALAITGKKSKYQEYLMSILNEYDRLIVIARDGYESNVEKKIIKVYTFEELLDARSILNKPIIYSRINNVKSEFIVEDEEVIYKFVLKEADMGE